MCLINKILICIICILTCIAKNNTKTEIKRPLYNGINKKFASLVNEYKNLALKKHIKFTKTVTIGFRKINRDRIIGLCNYSPSYREIDIDIQYWNNSSKISRKLLLFHELTHCYCNRGHDYGNGINYLPVPLEKIAKKIYYILHPDNKYARPGFYKDRCPLSIMYPYNLSDACFIKHSKEYESEMFNRCFPY